MADDDLESIDLEPVDLEPTGDDEVFERRADRRPAWIWIGVIAFVVAAGAVVGLTRRGTHTRPAATPASTTVPITAPPVSRATQLAPALRNALARTGFARWSVVIDGRLYVLDALRNGSTLVPLPEGHVTIDDQSGPSLLASTSEESLVGTQPIGARTLSDRDVAIRAVEPGEWWLLGSDGTIRKDGDPTAARRIVPSGLRVVAAVPGGFVALSGASTWAMWSGTSIRPIPVTGQFLTASATTLAFKSGCGYNGCSLEFVDLAHGSVVTASLTQVPQFAAFSPDGTRLALASTQGHVVVLDPATGVVIGQTVSLDLPSPSVPFTWTLDSRFLVVVQSHDIEIDGATNGTTAEVIPGTDGVEQVVALP